MAYRTRFSIDPSHRRWLAKYARRQGFRTPDAYLKDIVELALQTERLRVGDLGRDWHRAAPAGSGGAADLNDGIPF